MFSPDTSCMVAALLQAHPHHARATAALNRHFDAGDTMVIVAHTLLETFSSLTRMPLPARVPPAIALRAIEASFLGRGTVVALSGDQYAQLLDELARHGTVGGQVYDAAIVACARLAGVERILTFNARHFARFQGDGLSIVVP